MAKGQQRSNREPKKPKKKKEKSAAATEGGNKDTPFSINATKKTAKK